jgi:hypothetical protein
MRMVGSDGRLQTELWR